MVKRNGVKKLNPFVGPPEIESGSTNNWRNIRVIAFVGPPEIEPGSTRLGRSILSERGWFTAFVLCEVASLQLALFSLIWFL